MNEKQKIIHRLYQDLNETHNQYIDCYGEVVKLTESTEILRNSNLDLQVVNFNLTRDYEMLESRVKQYRNNVDILKVNNQLVVYKNDVLENIVKYLKTEMCELSEQLQSLQELLKITNEVPDHPNFNLTECVMKIKQRSESLIKRVKITKEQISHEIKLNEINKYRIEELEKVLDTKFLELHQSQEELVNVKAVLEETIQINREHEHNVMYLQQQIAEQEQRNERNANKYKSEMLAMNETLRDAKQKLQKLNEAIKEKSEEIVKLRSEQNGKYETVHMLSLENIKLKQDCKDKEGLKEEVRNLKLKLEMYKENYVEINEKYKKCQSVMVEANEREIKCQKEFIEHRNELNKKLKIAQEENCVLNMKVTSLSKELEETKIALSRNSIKSNDLDLVQDENVLLKNEINSLIQAQATLQTEIKQLNLQLKNTRESKEELENISKTKTNHLNQCLKDLNAMQTHKEKLEEKNLQLEIEMENLQQTYGELNREIQYKNESVVNLEHELSETKMSRDELRAESKRVVSNVRFWLQEQRELNQQLKETIKEKNITIIDLTANKETLLKNINDVYKMYQVLSDELQSYKSNIRSISRSPSPLKRSIFTWGSQGTLSHESLASSPSDLPNHSLDYEEPYTDTKFLENTCSPITLMKKVQNISEEIQKNNQYWKKKLRSKKRKSVRDTAT